MRQRVKQMKYWKQSKEAIAYYTSFSNMLELIKYIEYEYDRQYQLTEREDVIQYDVIFCDEDDLVLVHAVCEFFIHYFPETREVLESLNFINIAYSDLATAEETTVAFSEYQEIIDYLVSCVFEHIDLII